MIQLIKKKLRIISVKTVGKKNVTKTFVEMD